MDDRHIGSRILALRRLIARRLLALSDMFRLWRIRPALCRERALACYVCLFLCVLYRRAVNEERTEIFSNFETFSASLFAVNYNRFSR